MKTAHRWITVAWALAILASTATPLQAEAEDTLQKQFAVSPGGKVVIAADRGSIEVKTGGADKLEVIVNRKVGRVSDARAREILKNHEVTFEQSGNTVTVRSRSSTDWKAWRLSWPNFQVRYVVTVPQQFNLEAKTAGGGITIADLTGEVRAQTAGGNIEVASIDGPVWARTSGGSVKVESASGAIEARTSGGNVQIGEARATLVAGTSGGDVRVRRARGKAELRTSGGSIRAEQVFSEITAETSGGNVHLAFTGSPEGDCLARTSGGNITIGLPEKSSANIDASTSGGRVSTELPVTVQGEQKRSSLVGRLGDGGKLIKARTSGGNISLQRVSEGHGAVLNQ